MKRYLTFLILALGFLAAWSQGTATLEGKVLDPDGKALPHTEVLLKGTTLGTVSGPQGEYTLKGIPAGEQVVVYSFMGYEKHYHAMSAKGGVVFRHDVVLNPDIISLPSVIVQDRSIEYTPYLTTKIVKERMDRRAVRDIGDYLREIPNISAIRKGGANLDPVVRGFRFEQLNVQVNDGIKIEGGCPNRMDPTAAHVEVDDLEGIEVVKGPFALRYGPAMGGLVNLKTIEAKPYSSFQVHLKAFKGYESNWNGNKEHLTVTGGNDKVYFALSGNRSSYGNYTDGNGNIQRSQFDKFNRSARLGFAPAKGHEIQLAYIESFGRNVWFGALPMDERRDDTHIYSFDYRATALGGKLNNLHLKVYYADVDHEMDNKERSFSDTVTAISALQAGKYGYRLEGELKGVAGGRLFVGTDMEHITKDGDRLKYMVGQYPNPMGMVMLRVENLWNEAVIDNYGIFTEYHRTIGKNEITGALRLDMNSASSDSIFLTNMMGVEILNIGADSTQSDFVNFSFSAGVTRNLNKNLSLSLAIGRGVRSPNMLERFIIKLPVGYDNYEYVGNPQLLPEINNEADLTLTWNHSDYGRIEVNGFYAYVQNYITGRIIPGMPLTQTVEGIKEFYNADPVSFMGAEFTYVTPAKYDLGVSLVAGYTRATMSKVTRHIFDANGDPIDTEELTKDPLSEMPPFEATLAMHYSMFQGKLVPQVSLRAVASQNYVSEAFYEPTTPGFMLANFSAVYKLNSFVTVAGGVNNIFDKAYYEHLNRRIIGSSVKIYEPGRVFYANVIFNI